MIKGNIIEFGYGDVAVGSSRLMKFVDFTNIKPPLECGERITTEMEKDLEFGESIRIYEDGIWDIYSLMKTISENNRIVKYKEYTFDFSNYNEKSVKTVKEHLYNVIMGDILCLAC